MSQFYVWCIFFIVINIPHEEVRGSLYRNATKRQETDTKFNTLHAFERFAKLLKTDFILANGMKTNIHEMIKPQRENAEVKWINTFRESLKDKSKSFQFKLDPDADKNLTQLIQGQGYPVERYVVKTQDGFLLDLHRIPSGRKNTTTTRTSSANQSGTKPVIFLMHGFLCSAVDYVINFSNQSLGFVLADNGYDVWLGNSRGNTYSKRHVSLKTNDEKFWDWSFDEMALYDTPTYLDFILNKTGQPSLYYVGHSQGTVMAFALLSQQPELAKKIRLFVGLAPIISLEHMVSPLGLFSYLGDNLIYDILGRKALLQSDELVKVLVDGFCIDKETEWVCNDLLFILCGPDISNLNTSRVDVYMRHTPAGASVKDLVHYGQMVREKRFSMYDYGSPEENMKHYNQQTPPVYNASKVTVPSLLFTGSNDWFADPADVAVLNSTLPNIKGSYNFDTYNHLDFLWGMDAAVVCYTKMLQWLQKF